MDDLESRLQTLTQLSPPTSPELGADVLRQRATRVRRRSQMAIAVPAAALVVVLLATALAFRTRSPGEIVPAGPSDAMNAGAAALNPRDIELLDWIDASMVLRDQLVFEMFASATYSSSNKANRTELTDQRTRTDRALAALEAKTQQIDPGRDGPPTKDALKRLQNRTKILPTIRKRVDFIQDEAIRSVDDYFSTIVDLSSVERGLLQNANSPPFFRGLFNHSNLVAVTNYEAKTAALLIIVTTIRFYAAVLPTGSEPLPTRNSVLGQGCGNDAAAGGDNCKIYRYVVAAATEVAGGDKTFEYFAEGRHKQLKRQADAGLRYDELKRTAIEDGQGRNDLNGDTTGSVAVGAADFRATARDRIEALSRAERQVLYLVRSPNGPGPSGPDAFPPDFFDPGAPARTTTTAPATTVPAATATTSPRRGG